MSLFMPPLFAGPGMLLSLLIGGCTGILVIIPFWMISKKAGFSPWLSLLFAFPLAGLVYMWILAFTDWPSLKK